MKGVPRSWAAIMGLVLIAIAIATFFTESSIPSSLFSNGITASTILMNTAVSTIGIIGGILVWKSI